MGARLLQLFAFCAIKGISRFVWTRTQITLAGARPLLAALHKANPVSQLLTAIPGVGPLGAITMALTVEPGNFASGRHFAAWLGLTPKEHSTGGKQRMGKISKAGNEGYEPRRVCRRL